MPTNITAHSSLTKLSEACAELWEQDMIILKAYPNADGTKLRIVLPELRNFKQTRIDIESHYIEFIRSAK